MLTEPEKANLNEMGDQVRAAWARGDRTIVLAGIECTIEVWHDVWLLVRSTRTMGPCGVFEQKLGSGSKVLDRPPPAPVKKGR